MLAAGPTAPPHARRVVIVGAGPAGLATAIALRQAGVAEVTIVERSSLDRVLGSELSLHSAALRALETIGVAHACVDAGAVLEFSRYRTQEGELLGESRRVEVVTRDRSLPARIGISRPALHRVLTRAAREHGCAIRHDCAVSGIFQDRDAAYVQVGDDERLEADLVIGADGVNSFVREIVFPDAPKPEYCGQVAWRTRVPLLGPPSMEIYIAKGSKVGIIAVNDRESYLFHLEPEPSYNWIERERLPEILRAKIADYGGTVAELRDTIQDPELVHYSPLCPVLVPPPWHRGRVLLIGDAVHATTPHLAYGAALALEDGVVLGEELGKGASLDAALTAFATRRWPRCKMVVENGSLIAKWECAPDTPGADPLGLGARMQQALCEEI